MELTPIILALIAVAGPITVAIIQSGRTVSKRMDKQDEANKKINQKKDYERQIKTSIRQIEILADKARDSFSETMAWAYANQNDRDKVIAHIGKITELRITLYATTEMLNGYINTIHATDDFTQEKVDAVVMEINHKIVELKKDYQLT